MLGQPYPPIERRKKPRVVRLVLAWATDQLLPSQPLSDPAPWSGPTGTSI
jgi:hypothetical protein